MSPKKVPYKPASFKAPVASSGAVGSAASPASREGRSCAAPQRNNNNKEAEDDVPQRSTEATTSTSTSNDKPGLNQGSKGAGRTTTTRTSSSSPALYHVTSSDAVSVSEVRLAAAAMRALRLSSGAFVVVRSSVDVVYAECFLSPELGPSMVQLAPTTAALLVDADVTVLPASGSDVTAMLSVATLVTVVARPSDNTRGSAVDQVSSVALEALFQRALRHRVLFVGLVQPVRIAANQFYLEVTKIVVSTASSSPSSSSSASTEGSAPTTDGVPTATVGDSTQVVVSLSAARSDAMSLASTSTATGPSSLHPALSWDRHNLTEGHYLVVGDSGTGKSFYLSQLEAQLRQQCEGLHVMKRSVPDLLLAHRSEESLTLMTLIRELFVEAKANAPSVILLDDLHYICGTSSAVSSLSSKWALGHAIAAIKIELDAIADHSYAVRCVASAPSVEAIDGSLMDGRTRFSPDHTVTLEAPSNQTERLSLLTHMLRVHLKMAADEALTAELAEALKKIAASSHGCTQRDLSRLVPAALMVAFERCRGSEPQLQALDLLAASKTLRPSALKQYDTTIPNVTWADIGGSVKAKETLQDCVAWCLGKHQWLFEKYRLSPPRGVLLYGPPGCSKTMLAKALANESRLNFISVKGPEVFSKWVGDSEKAVRDIFQKARAVAPCVVFIDELDGMCAHRGQGGVSDRVISQFLTELDGLPSAKAFGKSSDSIVFVAATNRPENIDPAVLRPGRIDRKVHVGLPEESERRAIAALHIEKIPRDAVPGQRGYHRQANGRLHGSGGGGSMQRSGVQALQRDFHSERVEGVDLKAALEKVRPRVTGEGYCVVYQLGCAIKKGRGGLGDYCVQKKN
jgi:SpoVK/Ycf46/Vps4 family AAA+-type ATPase